LRVHLRAATPSDTAIVAAILTAAADRLNQRGQALWSAREVSEAGIGEHVRGGRYHVLFDGAQAVGVFRLEFEDALFWPEIAPGTSAFVHKVAVAPEHQGRGLAHELLRHACALTRAHGLPFLRLDCMGGRPRLRSVYEAFGFRRHSDKLLGSTLFHRFELDVAAQHPSRNPVR
jgi:GNAT superfamily N-acetyltransferase